MFDNLFENIGEKIKSVTKAFACVGMILSIILAIICFVVGGSYGILIGLLVGGIGFLLSWMGAWFIYGYGEIIQCLISINRKLEDITAEKKNKIEQTIDSQDKDKETLYQFALEKIEKKQYRFACDALKRILDYKDANELLEKISNL